MDAFTELYTALDETTRTSVKLAALITGGFRVGVAQRLVTRALSGVSGIPDTVLAHRLMGDWQPSAAWYKALLAPETADADVSRPDPYLSRASIGRRSGPNRGLQCASRVFCAGAATNRLLRLIAWRRCGHSCGSPVRVAVVPTRTAAMRLQPRHNYNWCKRNVPPAARVAQGNMYLNVLRHNHNAALNKIVVVVIVLEDVNVARCRQRRGCSCRHKRIVRRSGRTRSQQ